MDVFGTAAVPESWKLRKVGKQAFPTVNDNPTFGWASGILFGVILTLAAILRLANLDHSSLNHAEAWRANWTYQYNLEDARRFPPLLYALGWITQHFLGRTELLLRLPSALAGIVCVIVIFVFAKRIAGLWPGVAAAAVAAGHPFLVMHSREMKEFSFEALSCITLLWAGQSAFQNKTARSLWIFTSLSVIALGLSFTSSMVIVAWMPLLAWRYVKADRVRPLLAAALVLTAVGAAWYQWFAGCHLRSSIQDYYYLTIEPVWPMEYSFSALAKWFGSQSYGALQYVLGVSHAWPPLNWCIGTLLLLAISASLGPLWRRHRSICVVLLLIFVEIVAAGAMRMWPFGNVRHTTFLIPIVCVLAGYGLWRLVSSLRWSPASVFLVTVCILIPSVRAAKATVFDPQVHEHLRPVLQMMQNRMQPGDAVFVYYAADDIFKFYWEEPEVPVLIQPRSDRDQMPLFISRFDGWMENNGRVWFVFTHNWRNEKEVWTAHLIQRHQLLDQIEVADASAHLFASPN